MEINSGKLIGDIESLESILAEPSFQTLSVFFSTYRQIQPCNQNLLSALAVGIFDFSTIYNISEIILYMNHYRTIHDSQYSSEDKNSIVDALTKVYVNSISESTLEHKIESLNIIYLNNINSLVLLLRECAIYSAITLYNNSKYLEFSKNNPFDALFLKLYNRTSVITFEDLDMFFYAFSLHVHLFNPTTYDVCEYNPEGKYSIFFLDLPQGYYPLHTSEMYSIVVTSYTQRIHHQIPYAKSYIVNDLEVVQQKYKIECEKKIKACKDFIYIVTTTFQGATIDNINDKIHIQEDLHNMLLGYYCQYCKKFEECNKLSCGHYICKNELGYIAYENKHCIVCGEDMSNYIDIILSTIQA